MNSLGGLLVYLWLAGAASAVAADPAVPVNWDDQRAGNSRDDMVYAAAFNPFASVGIATEPPAVEAPTHTGDWALPLLLAVGGMVGVGVLIRRLLD